MDPLLRCGLNNDLEQAMSPSVPKLTRSLRIGHLGSFIQDFSHVVGQVRSLSMKTGGPVSLLLGGTSVCFITSAEDSQVIHRDSAAFSHDKFLQLTARQFGVSKKGVTKLWTRRNASSANSKPLARIMAIVRRELSALRRPGGLPQKVLQHVWDLSTWEKMSSRSVCEEKAGERTVFLSRWVRDIFMQASTQVLFGDKMLELSPSLIEDFYTFDDRSWMVLYGIPIPWSIRMRMALNRTQNALKRFLEVPEEDRVDASVVMKQLEEAMQDKGFTSGDVPAVLSLIYWGFNTNAWKACFWCLCHILNDVALLHIIADEVTPVVNECDSPGELATRLRQCPKLNSAYLETLRYTAAIGSARESLREWNLRGKRILPHTDLVITYRGILTDSTVYGADAKSFVWDRFLRGGALVKSPAFKPFGDGVGQCPGRFLAQSEILLLIALAITRFDICVPPKTKLPALDTRTPSLGMMGPMGSGDFQICMKPMGL